MITCRSLAPSTLTTDNDNFLPNVLITAHPIDTATGFRPAMLPNTDMSRLYKE